MILDEPVVQDFRERDPFRLPQEVVHQHLIILLPLGEVMKDPLKGVVLKIPWRQFQSTLLSLA